MPIPLFHIVQFRPETRYKPIVHVPVVNCLLDPNYALCVVHEPPTEASVGKPLQLERAALVATMFGMYI